MKNSIWSRPWGYPEAWIIIGGLLLIGYLWQFILGHIPVGGFTHSLSITILFVLLFIAIYVGVRGSSRIIKKRGQPPVWVQFLLSPAATISAITAFLITLLIMGFTTQAPPQVTANLSGFLHKSGWSSMVHSYPFVQLYLYFLLILGSISVRRLMRFTFTLREIGFLINHLGLFCFLSFALLSGGVMKRFTMILEQNQVEWRGLNYHDNKLVELPLALTLKEFHMDEYPPNLSLLDSRSGELIKKDGQYDFISVDTAFTTGSLSDWEVRINEYLPLAAPILTDEEIVFKEFGSSGAAPAVKITASRHKESYTGWVSCGSYLFPYRALALPDSISIVMPYPEPRQYYSEVEYIHKNGVVGEGVISVNNPLKVGDWYIYQLNYDQEKGRWGISTELELVYDPFIRPVLISIWALLVGALFLLLGPANAPENSNQKKKGDK